MSETFIAITLSIIILLIIANFLYLLSKKINFPYTILLVLAGLILIPISKLPGLEFLQHFRLSPEVLFFVFLPILIFESWYNIKYKQLKENRITILSLAVAWLLISTILIWLWLYYWLQLIWFKIPFEICLLFWAIISATDPVAVLSLFKEVWAPRRLALIFEWESLFNDWTALALFLSILEGIKLGVFNWETAISGLIKFFIMLLGWAIFGAIIWIIFAKVIEKIKNHEYVEITLTMILAHLTFILTELINIHIPHIEISGIIATAIAAIIMWNYWKYKISPKVEEYMDRFWWFFAFLSNSLVFILIWFILSKIHINISQFILPTIIAIIVVIIARAISVYLPLNLIKITKLEEPVPSSRQHLLAWWSLRWALAIMMWLMIPDNLSVPGWNYPFTIKEFLLTLIVMSIMFTLFVKAPTIKPLIKLFKLNKLNKWEKFELLEWNILINLKLLKQIENLFKQWFIHQTEYEEFKNIYTKKLKEDIEKIKKFLKEEKNTHDFLKRAILIHALGMEKMFLKELFTYREIDEYIFKYLLKKIDTQIERLKKGLSQFKTFEEKQKKKIDIFEKIWQRLDWINENSIIFQYLKNRAKILISQRVIEELEKLKKQETGFDLNVFDEVIEIYKGFLNKAKEKLEKLYEEKPTLVNWLNAKLLNKNLMKLEENIVKDLYKKEIITPKLYHKFLKQIEEEIEADIKKIDV